MNNKCGDYGYQNAFRQPCGQTLREGETACLWHRSTPAERSAIASRGGRKKSIQENGLPEEAVASLSFQTIDQVVTFVETMAKQALTSPLHRGRIETALKCANVAKGCFETKATQELTRAVLTMEHGGGAVLLLQRLQEGMAGGARKPLPGRRMPVVELSETGAPEEAQAS